MSESVVAPPQQAAPSNPAGGSSPPASGPSGAAPASAPDAGPPGGSSPSAAGRPEWLPEKFQTPEALAKSYLELEKMRGRFKEEAAAELRAGLPDAPDGYEIKADGLPENVVWLDSVPDNFQPEEGKAYFVANPNAPEVAALRQWAHENGVKPEGFAKLMGIAAQAMAQRVPTRAEREAQRNEFLSSLGENGAARAGHLWGQLQARFPQHAEALNAVVGNKAAFEAVEAMLHAAGGARFAPSGAATAPAGLTENGLREMMRDPRYTGIGRPRDPDYVAQVTNGWKALYPGGPPGYANGGRAA